MATDKKRSKGRFLYLFDWNSKSKKKLFSNKSEFTEGSTHGNDTADNSVVSPYLLSELCENGNYSCASSVSGDDGYVPKPPGVVARLMGLDSIPTTSIESTAIPILDSQSINGRYYHGPTSSSCYSHPPNNLEGSLWNNTTNTKRNKIYGRPIERFQTEVLPPKSAKPISITHHRLLSPIKSPGFVPTRDAAYIMEAAARIIEQSPQKSSNLIRIPSIGSPSSSFRLQDLKDKMDKMESSRTPKRSNSVRKTGGELYDRSSSRSLFRNSSGLEASSSHKGRSKGKSVSVVAHDRTNMPRKDREVCNPNRSLHRKEPTRVRPKQNQPNSQKNMQVRASTSKTSDVLRPNNDKRVVNSLPPEHRRGKSVGPSKTMSKVLVNGENGSKKVVTASNGAEDKRVSLNRARSKNKRDPRRDNRLSEDLLNPSGNGRTRVHNKSCHSESKMDMDVVSFTFTSPIKKSGTQTSSSKEASRSTCGGDTEAHDMSAQSHAKRSLLSPNGLNVIDSGSLSVLLEQKLKELTDKVVANENGILKKNAGDDSVSCCSESVSSRDIVGGCCYDEWSDKDQAGNAFDDDCTSSLIAKSSQKWKDFDGIEEDNTYDINKCEPSRNSVIKHLSISISECSTSESCMSSKTTSNITSGYDQPSSPQSQEVTSCISTESINHQEDQTNSVSYWELDYIRHILHYSRLKTYTLDTDPNLIDLSIFNLLENLITKQLCSQLDRKLLFDAVVELVRSRYELVSLGSLKDWLKWGMLTQNGWMTEDIYKEVLSLQNMGHLMVDEVVDRDMSSYYGRWVDFRIESLEEGIDIQESIVSSLVDELITDLSI